MESKQQDKSGGCCGGGKKRDATIVNGKSFKMGGSSQPRLKTGAGKSGQSAHAYSKENTIDVQTIIDAKIVLLGDSGVGKSSVA